MKIFGLALCFVAISCCSSETFSDSYRKRLDQRAEQGLLNLADRLIDLKCVNTVNDEQTLLHACVHRNQLACVEKLLDNGADPLIGDNYHNRTALFYAETSGFPNITSVIKAHLNNSVSTDGAVENSRHCQLNSTQWDQAYFDSLKPTLMEIVTDGTVNKPEANWGGQTLLHLFAKTNKILMVKFLLEHGADPNLKDNYDKLPMEYADDKEIVNVLINAVHSTTQEPSI